MIHGKFQFNRETLSYDKIELTPAERFKRIAVIASGTLAALLLFVFLIFPLFKDLNTKQLERENEKLLQHYELLNQKVVILSTELNKLQARDDSLYRAIFETEPMDSTLRRAGVGGSNPYADLKHYQHYSLMRETAERLDQLIRKAKVQNKSFDELMQLAEIKKLEFDAIPALRPVSSHDSHLSSEYGYRFHPILRRFKMHQGIDFSAPVGTKIYAPANGTVVETKTRGGYGRQIKINHGFGFETRYAHLNKILVVKGQRVRRGEVIGEVGNSGLSTASHLHYEVVKDKQRVNPLDYFYANVEPEDYLEAIAR